MLKSWLRLHLAALSLFVFSAAAAQAVPPTHSLLPDSTKGYVAAANVDTLVERWNQSPMGKLFNDPLMKPFTDDLRRQLKQKWSKTHARLGITVENLQGIATGEACLAVVMPKDADASLIIMADVTGKEKEALAMLDRVAANLKAQGAKATRQKLPGVEVSVFDSAAKHDRDHAISTIHYVKEGLFVATDSLAIARDVAARLDRPQQHTLASVAAYQTVMKRCEEADPAIAPDVRWFIEPIGLAEALRSWENNRRKGSTDYLKVAKNQGFGAIKGVGGFTNLSLTSYGILHRTYIYAPPPYELAMRMAVFPNGGDFAPQEWVARDVSTYMSFQVDML
ncbi:MAG: hypothetical protein ACREHD_03500, partial [Pirellulales bacterium]